MIGLTAPNYTQCVFEIVYYVLFGYFDSLVQNNFFARAWKVKIFMFEHIYTYIQKIFHFLRFRSSEKIICYPRLANSDSHLSAPRMSYHLYCLPNVKKEFRFFGRKKLIFLRIFFNQSIYKVNKLEFWNIVIIFKCNYSYFIIKFEPILR